MPLVDVTEMLHDPDYAEHLVVVRRPVTVGDNGIQKTSPFFIEPKPIGVVVPRADASVFRGPEQQHLPRHIDIFTQFMLQGPAEQSSYQVSTSTVEVTMYLPDHIRWSGDIYIVNKVIPWGKWGDGFVVANCSSIKAVDNPPKREDYDDAL